MKNGAAFQSASICSISHLLLQLYVTGSVLKLCVLDCVKNSGWRGWPYPSAIETIPSLRLIPDLTVMRPADGNETAGAYKYLVKYK